MAKISLQQKVAQQLAMTPQLQQAIALLQLSSQELNEELREALENNPLLEADDLPSEDAHDLADSHDPADLEMAAVQDSFYRTAEASRPGDSGLPEREIVDRSREDLPADLRQQLDLRSKTDTERRIGLAIIDAIDERGYLREDLAAIASAAPGENNFDADDARRVLELVQSFEPAGIAASDVRECLLLQLQHQSGETVVLARELVDEHFEKLAEQSAEKLAEALGASEQQVRQALETVQALEPYPGRRLGSLQAQYIQPEIVVEESEDGVFRPRLFEGLVPKLSVNKSYAALARSAKGDDATYLRGRLQEARWLIRSIEARNETLLRVSQAIVSRQQKFFAEGILGLRPMVMREVAEEIDMHESTVSRVTTAKYMLTSRGVFELRYFFSSSVATQDGGRCSAKVVQERIRRLVATENPSKPLSDQTIADRLCDHGIEVARRTVAKYRNAIDIPSSSKRRRRK